MAIVDTGINLEHLRGQGLAPRLDPHVSWSPISGVKPGHFSVDHGTMCAFATSIVAPQSVLLDLPVLQSRRAGGSIMDGLLSDAILAYSVLLQMMRTPEDQRPYHALVVSNSWGMFHPGALCGQCEPPLQRHHWQSCGRWGGYIVRCGQLWIRLSRRPLPGRDERADHRSQLTSRRAHCRRQ